MTPQDDDVEPGDETRAMWRYPVWKRTIVMSAGSVTHFLLGIVILWVLFAFVALPNDEQAPDASGRRSTRSPPCVATTWQFDPATKQAKDVRAGHRPGQRGLADGPAGRATRSSRSTGSRSPAGTR